MKVTHILCILLSLMVMSCATTYEETVAVPSQNHKHWIFGSFGDHGQRGYITEFIPPGDKIENWSELYTNQFLKGVHMPLGEAVASTMETIKGVCPDVVWSILEEDSNSLTYEWWTLNCPQAGAQHELSRFLAGKDGLHRVAYTRKGGRMDSSTRFKWLDTLKKAIVINGNTGEPIPGQTGELKKGMRSNVVRQQSGLSKFLRP